VSSYAPTPAMTVARPARPMLLLIAMGAAVLGAAGAIAAAVQGLVGGRGLVEDLTQQIVEAQGVTMADLQLLGGDAVNELLDDATATLHTRAIMLLVGGVALLVTASLTAKAAIWARVLTTIAAALCLIFCLVTVGDIASTGMNIAGRLGALGALLTIVLIWLGPINRYRKALSA